MTARFQLKDWLALGFEALAADGPQGITIEAICERAGKTRGSFYHHFKTADGFLSQLLGWWQKTYTDDLIEKVERLAAHNEKLDHLNHLAAHLDPDIEQAFRRLAASHEMAAQTCRQVDDKRIAYLAKLYAQSPRFNSEQAKMLAKIEYAAWVGFQVIEPDASPGDMLAMYDMFLQLTGRGK